MGSISDNKSTIIVIFIIVMSSVFFLFSVYTINKYYNSFEEENSVHVDSKNNDEKVNRSNNDFSDKQNNSYECVGQKEYVYLNNTTMQECNNSTINVINVTNVTEIINLNETFSSIVFKNDSGIFISDINGKVLFNGINWTDDSSAIQYAINRQGKIFIRSGVYRISNILINKDNIHIEGEGWNTLLERNDSTIGIKLEVPVNDDGLDDISIRNLQIDGNFRAYPIITNMHDTGFEAGDSSAVNHFTIENVKFVGGHELRNVIELRNPDNKLVLTRNWFQSISGTPIYIESNGRAAGNIEITSNIFLQGTKPKSVIYIKTIQSPVDSNGDANASNVRRINILLNTINSVQGNNATGILLERYGGFLDHINIEKNSFEDTVVAIDVGGKGTSYVEDVNIHDNSIFQRTNPANPNSTGIVLRNVSRKVFINNNHIEGKPGIGFTGIIDQSYPYGTNTIGDNTFKAVDVEEIPFITKKYLTRLYSVVVFKNSSGTYAVNWNDSLVVKSSDDYIVIQTAINSLPKSGGKILIKSGTYILSDYINLENRRDPYSGTVEIEGEGYNKNTILKLNTASNVPVMLSLKNSSHIVLRDLQMDANKKADYVIRMERASDGISAGNNRLENLIVVDSNKAGILVYGAENVYMDNVLATFGNPIGAIITGFPPVDDPTVVDNNSINVSGQEFSTGGITLINSQFGYSTHTTKASLIVYRANVRMYGGMLQASSSAEANVILDEVVMNSVFDGLWIDDGALRGFRIGNYPSSGNYPSFAKISGINARAMDGDGIIVASNLAGSRIESISTSRNDGKIILSNTTKNNYIGEFTHSVSGAKLNVMNNGIGNFVQFP